MTYNVLYVDDEQDLLNLGKIFLESQGDFSVDTQSSAQEGLEILKTRSYDAIISDYQMPDMDGLLFLKEVRAAHGDLPFILFTGRGREEVVIEAINNGADFYLQKGGEQKAQFSELAHKIKKAVERRQAQQTIRALINAPPDVSMLLDTGGKILGLNKAATIRFEKSEADLIGTDAYPLLSPGLASMKREEIQELVASREPLIHTDNRTGRSFEHHFYPVIDQGGEVTAVAVHSRDVTEAWRSREELQAAYGQLAAQEDELRKQYEALKEGQEHIRESEEKYRLVVENSHDSIYIYRTNRFLFINRQATDLTGYSHDELMDMNLWNLIHPDDRSRLQESASRRLSGEEVSSAFYAKILTKSGEVRDGEFYVDLIIFQGQPAILGIARDITEKKRIMEALRESEEQLHSLSDNLPRGMVYQMHTGPDGKQRFIHVSAGVEQIHGVSAEQVLQDPMVLYGQIVPEDLIPFREAEKRARESMSTFSYETRIRTPSGEERWVLLRSAPRPHPDGGIIWDGIELDITAGRLAEEELKAAYEQLTTSDEELQAQYNELKQSQEQLTESEELHKKMVIAIPDIIVRTDLDGNIVFINDKGLKLGGYVDPAGLVGRSIFSFFAPESLPLALENSRLMFERPLGPKEYEFIINNGPRISLEVNGDILRTPEGSPYGMIFICRDITERKRTEEALHLSEENYRQIIENIQDVFYRINGEGIITMISPYGARLVGFDSPAEIIAKIPAKEFYADPDERDAFFAFLKREKVVTGYPLTLKDRSGNLHYATASSRLLYNASGNISGIEGILHDITPLRQTERALRQANRQITLMASITRHDIRNQLNVLAGWLELSRASVDDPERMLELITKEQKIADIIEQQIGFTKFFDDMGVKDPVWQDPAPLVRKAQESLPFGNIRLDMDLAGIEIFADPLFEKVFYNLLDNAIRYGGGTMTTIRVTAKTGDDKLTLVVEDDGFGIRESNKERIFTRGFGKNTGLGLFLIKEILSITGITIKETGIAGTSARFEMLVPKGTYRFCGK